MNLQPFHSWNRASSGRQKGSVTPENALNQEGPPEFLTADAAGVFRDDVTDLAQEFVRETDDVPLAICSPVSASVSGFSESYNLKPRWAPRVTSGWLDDK